MIPCQYDVVFHNDVDVDADDGCWCWLETFGIGIAFWYYFVAQWKLLLFVFAFVSDSFTSIISPDWRCQSIASANFIADQLLHNNTNTHTHIQRKLVHIVALI